MTTPTPYWNMFFAGMFSVTLLLTGCDSKPKPGDSDRTNEMVSTSDTENEVETPPEVSTIKQLKLDNTETDDTALEKICQESPELVELTLGGTKVTNAGLVHLTKLTKLRKIRLSKTVVTDAGMNTLAKCRRLEDVDVSQTKIGSPGVMELAALPRLKRLNLYLTFVTNAGLDLLQKTTAIEWLNLDKCPVTDAGLPKLAALSNLAWLHLGGTAVTDTGLAELAKLSSLKEVFVTKTETTLEGIEKLRQERPDMTIRDNVSEQTPPEEIEEAAEYRKQLVEIRERDVEL